MKPYALPHKEDYLLELTNNNYSQQTVKNYRRDLNFLEAFMFQEDLSYAELNKLVISRYKGYLQAGEHIEALTKLGRKLLKEREIADLSELGLTARQTKESNSEAPRSDFKKKEGLSPRSINRMLSALRNYLKFLIEIDYEPLPLAPDAVKLIKTERKESQVAELSDLLKLIEAPEEFESNPLVRARNRAMLELLFSTGMRISELVNLDREQLTIFKEGGTGGEQTDPEQGNSKQIGSDEVEETNPHVAGKMYISGKGKKSRFIYLTPRAKHWLERYLESRRDLYPALFIPYRGGRAGTKDPGSVRISQNYLQDKIVQYRRKLGIVVPTSAHSLRHGFATYLAEEGANPAAIQKLLGHESLQTTTRYVHASDKFAEKAHRKFHPAKKAD